MTIERTETRVDSVRYTFEITEDYVASINESLKGYEEDITVTEQDIADAMRGNWTDKMELKVTYIYNDGNPWVENLGDLLKEWVLEDMYDKGTEEYLDGEVTNEWVEIS